MGACVYVLNYVCVSDSVFTLTTELEEVRARRERERERERASEGGWGR